MKKLLLCLLISISGMNFISAAEQELCNPVTYNALSVDFAYEVLPDETDVSRLPACARWERFTSGNPGISVVDDTNANNGKAARITDFAHSERLEFRYEIENPKKITARLKVEAPSGAPEFQGGTLGIFLEIDDGISRLYMNLLNQDFSSGADPEVGIAGAGALNQYGTYVTYIVYWDDGAYHLFELSRNSDGSATLVVDGDGANAVQVPAGSLQPTSGTTGFRFGAANSGISEAYWDEVILESESPDPDPYVPVPGFTTIGTLILLAGILMIGLSMRRRQL
jgi:hypothetical protein